MVENTQIDQLRKALKRIFSLPISQSTYKELQTTIFNVLNQDRDAANNALEVLLAGETGQNGKEWHDIIEEFSIPARLSKDVLEKGQFINFMSSDLMRQGNRALFTNSIRRVDGEHFQFFSEPEGIIRLIEHFTGRLEEIDKLDNSKQFVKENSKAIEALKERLQKML